jgi:hypothetical protein
MLTHSVLSAVSKSKVKNLQMVRIFDVVWDKYNVPSKMKINKLYSKTCLKRNLKGAEHFSAEARFPFNQGIL